MRSPPNWVKQALAESSLQRGRILSTYANVEFLLLHLWMCCKELPEYQTIVGSPPTSLRERIERAQNLFAAPGRLQNYGAVILPLIDQVNSFTKMRNFLAHGWTGVRFHESSKSIVLDFTLYNVWKGAVTKEQAVSDPCQLA